jgi:hypothetical protein
MTRRKIPHETTRTVTAAGLATPFAELFACGRQRIVRHITFIADACTQFPVELGDLKAGHK